MIYYATRSLFPLILFRENKIEVERRKLKL